MFSLRVNINDGNNWTAAYQKRTRESNPSPEWNLLELMAGDSVWTKYSTMIKPFEYHTPVFFAR